MSYIICGCGFRADGTPKQALAAYREHNCELHPSQEAPADGWAVAGWIAFLVFLTFVCTHGWGLIK